MLSCVNKVLKIKPNANLCIGKTYGTQTLSGWYNPIPFISDHHLPSQHGLVWFVWVLRPAQPFFGCMEPRQKPVAGLNLLLIAKHDKGSLKFVSPKTVWHTITPLLPRQATPGDSDKWRAPPILERAICWLRGQRLSHYTNCRPPL